MKIKNLKEKLEIGYFEEEVLLDALLEILGNPDEEDDIDGKELYDAVNAMKWTLKGWLDILEDYIYPDEDFSEDFSDDFPEDSTTDDSSEDD